MLASSADGFVGWLVHVSPDISVNLIAAALGGTAVWLTTRAGRRLRLVRARRFWRALGRRGPFVVLGAHRLHPMRRWAKAGLVGVGDIRALVEVESQLRGLGFAGRIVEAKELTPRDLRSDLVLIGGPDGNFVTGTMLRSLGEVISYEFVKDSEHRASAVRNRESGRVATPSYTATGDPATDVAVIVRVANPLAPDTSEIVILAGCWEHGTAAAAELVGEPKFLRQVGRMKHFEALVETTVVHGSHYNTKVREIREITATR